MRLVDVGSEFPQLKRRNGMSSWIVFDGEGKEVSDFAGVDAAAQPEMKKSFFPPTMDEIGAFNLERWYVRHHMQFFFDYPLNLWTLTSAIAFD
jgi:hypothetical protein